MRSILTSSVFVFLLFLIASHSSLADPCLTKSDSAFFERLINNSDPLIVDSYDDSYKYLKNLGKNRSGYRTPIRHLFNCHFIETDAQATDDMLNEYLSYAIFLLAFLNDKSLDGKVFTLRKYEKMKYFDFYIYKTSNGIMKKNAFNKIKKDIIESKYETYNFFIAAFLGRHKELLPVLLNRWHKADGGYGELLSGAIEWFYVVDKKATIKVFKEYLKSGSDEHLKKIILQNYISK